MKQTTNINKGKFSRPLYFFVLAVVLIFFAEALIMLFLSLLPEFSLYKEALFDSLFLSIIIVPMLYVLLFRPMLQYIKERISAEKELQKSNELLESHIESRTRKLTVEITERKRAEEDLVASEEKMRSIAETALDAIIMIDNEANILFWNYAAERLFGYSKKEAIGANLTDLIIPEMYNDQFQKGIRNFSATGEGPFVGKTTELTAKRKDGTLFPIAHSISAVKVDGKWGAVGIIHDITERKQAEQALLTSEERFAYAMKGANDGLWDWNLETNKLYFSPRWKSMLGYADNELEDTYETWERLVHTDDIEHAKQAIDNYLTGKSKKYEVEFQMEHKDGSWVDILARGFAVRSPEDGKPIRLVGTHVDISERKRAESELKNLSTRHQAILESVPDIIMEVDAQKVYQWANRAGHDFFGEDVVGREASDYFRGDQDTYSIVQPLFNGQEDVIYLESWQRRKDNVNRLLAWWCRVLKDSNGNVVGALSTARDITEQKHAEEQILAEAEIAKNLLRLSYATTKTVTIDELMKHVVGITSDITATTVVLSYLWGPETKTFRPCTAVGLTSDMLSIFRTTPISLDVISIKDTMNTGRVFVEYNETSSEPLKLQQDGFCDWVDGAKLIAILPLVGKREYLGLLVCICTESSTTECNHLSDRSTNLMQSVANQVSTSLEEARHYNESICKAMELSQKVETIQIMSEIDKAILSAVHPQEILETTVKMITRIIHCDRCTVITVDKEGFIYAAGSGTTSIKIGSIIPYGDTNSTEVIETLRPQYISDLRDEKELPRLERSLVEEGFLSHIRVPLLVRSEAVGVLNVGSKHIAAFSPDDLTTLEKLATQIGIALENARLITDLEEFSIGTVKALAETIDAKSPWTRGHSERVTDIALKIGRELGLNEEELRELRVAGLLHDIGKIGTYESILDKTGKLTEEEYQQVQMHPEKGAEILSPIKQLSNILPIIRGHHEFYDGSGYPDGLKGTEIPFRARILTVADTVDAMGADRPYRHGLSEEKIINELKRCSGIQFDPDVVEAYLKIYQQERADIPS